MNAGRANSLSYLRASAFIRGSISSPMHRPHRLLWVARARRRAAKLLANDGIVRNRLKIAAAIQNAKAFLDVQKEFGTFDRYLWQFVGGRPIVNRRTSLKRIPATTAESDAMSKDLLKRNFKFVGSTICYAMMQAVGMVNDHEVKCFRYKQVGR